MTSLDAVRSEPRVAKLGAELGSRSAVEVDNPSAQRAAVAILVRLGDGDEPEVFFIRRATFEGDPWSGQIAFPGGREENQDDTLAATAMRETLEETGIDLGECGELIGVLDDLHSQIVRLPSIVVRPFVFLVARCADLVLSSEVADCFWVPMTALLDRSMWRNATVRAGGREVSTVAFHHRDFVVWGMTERILSGMLALVG